MATAARSAAERVFAIAELLEDIVLRVIQAELEGFSMAKRNLATSFNLQRINRDAYGNIAGSIKIRELALIRVGTEKLDTWDRIRWLRYESGKWTFGLRAWMDRAHSEVEYGDPIQLPTEPRPSWLDDNPDASWRALSCLPAGTQSVKLDIRQSIPSRFWYLGMNPQPLRNDVKYLTGEVWSKRLTTLQLDDQYTLGQLYDYVAKTEYEQSMAFAKG